MKKPNLNSDFLELEKQVRSGVQTYGGSDTREILGIALLGQAITKLDHTSTFLSWVNISVGIVVALIGTLQIYLMIKGH
jgi:hypothetical protein